MQWALQCDMVQQLHCPLLPEAWCMAGTSACAAGSFYCRNRGYEPLTLNSSMVDDGFCGRSLFASGKTAGYQA